MSENKEKKCPACGVTAKTYDEIKRIFGFRNMKDSQGRITIRSQSFCKMCRNNHNKNKSELKDWSITKNPTVSSQSGEQYNFDVEKFTNDWNSGMNLIDLAKKYNFSYPEKAKRLGQELGLKKRKTLTYFEKFLNDSKKINELVTMYNDKSIKILEIASHFEFVDKGYVSKLVKKMGITPRIGYRKSSKFDECKNEFTKMWNENIHVKTMMQKLDISDATINLWRDKLGLQPRTTGRHKEDSVANKIEQLLIENSGALTTTEIKKYLNREQIQLGKYYKSKIFQRVSLTLHKTGRSRRAPTDYFGDDTGQSIVFLYGMQDCLILKLSKILQKGNAFKNNMLKSGYYNFMINRLAESENEIKKRSNQLHRVTHNQQIQNKLEDSVKSELKKYKIKHESNNKIVRYESNNLVIQDILKDMPKSKFYGRKFNVESVIKELDSSYPEQQRKMIQEIFTPFNFICKSLTDSYFDLELISNSTFFIKLMLHQQINQLSLKIFQNNLQGNKGIIINFQQIPENVLKNTNANISIIGKKELSTLLNKIKFLPINSKSIAKIIYGENKDKIVFCEVIDFETNTADIKDIDGKMNKILIKFLKQIELPQNTSYFDFFDFIKKLETVSTRENISSLDEYSITIISFVKKINSSLISAQIDSNITKISMPHNMYDENVRNFYHSTSTGFLRNVMIQCDCLAWISQERIFLCKHSIALLFYLWKKDGEESDQFLKRKKIEEFLEYINFLINYSIRLEELWFQKMDFAANNKILVHHAICNIIKNDHLKADSFYNNCTNSDKLELENLMKKYYDENRELFESVKDLSDEQKNIVINTLIYQFKEKQEKSKHG